MDQYAHWRRRLAGEDLPIHENQIECGRYKMRRAKGGKFEPVAIFMKDGEMLAAIGKEFVAPEKIWLHAVKHPVSEADYKYAMANGHFPDEPAPRTIGDNAPPETIEEQIPLEIEQAHDWLAAVGAITNQRDADIAGNRVSALRKLKSEAEAEHRREKAPHLEAGRKVDAKWKPLIEDCEATVKALLAAVTKWANAEAARRAREAEEARRKAEAEAEEKRRQAQAQGQPEPEDSPLPLEVAPPPKVQVGGARGPKIGLRTETVAVITDYAAALAHFRDHEDIKSCVMKLAQRAAKAGVAVPGVKIEKVQKAA
jgi:hypothetical protein